MENYFVWEDISEVLVCVFSGVTAASGVTGVTTSEVGGIASGVAGTGATISGVAGTGATAASGVAGTGATISGVAGTTGVEDDGVSGVVQEIRAMDVTIGSIKSLIIMGKNSK